eukprot:COSAG04_NODE_32747_length_197_cov_85.591837_1_plen_36_part_01
MLSGGLGSRLGLVLLAQRLVHRRRPPLLLVLGSDAR